MIFMKFYGLKDFFENKELFRSYYKCMSFKKKKYYKMYVYSISFENEYIKDLIWEYLNEDEFSEELITKAYYQRMARKK